MAKRKKTPAVACSPAKGKAPAIQNAPGGKKAPAVQATPGVAFSRKMAWHLGRVDTGGKFRCTLKDLEPYRERLAYYETLSRHDAERLKHCHPLGPAKVSAEGQARIRMLDLDLATFHQLRLDRNGRLWGFWEKNVFNIVWLDPGHGVYIPGSK